ncbi:MAG: hypothetical protein AAB368_11070, partial [bacterium]
MTTSGGGTKTAGGAFSLASNGTLTVSTGVFDPATYLITGSGTNTLTVGSGGTLKVDNATYALNYSEGFTTNTFNSASTIEYSRAGDQTIRGDITMGNLTISGTGTKSLSANSTALGTTTISGGILDVTGSNFTLDTGAIVISGGTFLPRGSIVSLTGVGTVFSFTSGTFTAGISTLKLTDSSSSAKTFAGGGQTFRNVFFEPGAGTGTYTISGNNTIFEFKDDGSVAHSILFTAGSTNTIANWRVKGNPGNLITLNSTSPTTKWYLVNTNQGYAIGTDYISLRDSQITSSNIAYAGPNSVDDTTGGSTNVGWTFTVRSHGGGSGNVEASATPNPQVGGGVGGGVGGDDSSPTAGGIAVVTNSVVTSVTMTSGGTGYGSPP